MKNSGSSRQRIIKLLIGGGILFLLAYGVFQDGFSKSRALLLQDCALQSADTNGWVLIKRVPVTYSLPAGFKWNAKMHQWTDGERTVLEGWFERLGSAKPNMSKACKLGNRPAILDREVKGDRIWFSLEFLDITGQSAPSSFVLLVHGKKSDEKLFEGILKTARMAE